MLRKSLLPLLSHGIRQAVPFLSSGAGASLSFSSSSNTLSPCNPREDQINENNQDSRPTRTISIDRSGLHNPPGMIRKGSFFSSSKFPYTLCLFSSFKQPFFFLRAFKFADHFHKPSADSELVKHLKSIIKFRGGPISIAEYMEEVLTNPNCGFYINRDVFGACGDFITSPEVSQMFGEMVGVWTMCLWEQLGRPTKVNLVELGPGRGTLMADLLRGSSKFVDFSKSLDIHLVECSPTLQKLQYNTLKCIDEAISRENNATRTITSLTGTPVLWHADLERVPSGSPTIIIAHEFYDALPIHQFQKTHRGWSEKMIDISEEDSSFRFVLSPQPTPASLLYLRKRCQWAEKEEIAKLEQIEVCPRALELTHQIAKRISIDGGGALIIDYGKNEIISDSLQAIRKHKFVRILDDPGSADLSTYVDFAAIRRSAEEASENISVYGPISQSQLLGSLGINFRVEALLQNCTEEQAESLRAGYWRLVGDGEAPFWEGTDELKPIGMGLRYLAMAIVNKKQGIPLPF